MELVDGPTLADRLVSGPLSVSEALGVAIQIAEGLEAAHEKGIAHRDLKPANIKLTSGGAVKILDFGLAKAWGDPHGPSELTHSPTIAAPTTHAGVILGTAAYMSPEQAEGRPVDRRADVWAFGTVLFEMLTGKPAFDGKSVSHVIVNVLEQEPEWTRLPQTTPAIVRDVLERCLKKDPSQRPRDIGDLRLQLQAVAKQTNAARAQVGTAVRSATSPPTRKRWLWPTLVAGFVVVSITAFFLFFRQERPAPEPVRFEIAQPRGVNFTNSLSLSHDGRQLAFIAVSAEGNIQIWLRTLNAIEARPLQGTEGVDGVPFWSPDGRRLAFSSNGSLKTIEVSGGPAQTVSRISGSVLSGFWTPDNTLVIGISSGSGILRMSVNGGNPTPLTRGDGSTTDGFPVLLPDGRHFLFSRLSYAPSPETGIYIGSLEGQTDSQPRMLLPDVSPVAYSTSSDPSIGYILFVRSTSPSAALLPREASAVLMAQRFDARTLQLVGDPAMVASDVTAAGFSASSDGVLVYGTGPLFVRDAGGAVEGQLTWFDRQGKVLGTIDDRAIYMSVELSPDDSEAAFMRADQSGNMDIWVADLTRRITRRLTFDAATDWFPVWSPDGRRIAFASARGWQLTLYERAANGEGEDKVLSGAPQGFPLSWSRDGRLLLYAPGGPAQTDVWALPMDGGAASKPLPVLNSMFRELAFFAPDGQWITYTSTESGRTEVYVRPFNSQSPSAGGKTRVSTDGGINTRWSADGSEIFYMTVSGEMMALDVKTKPALKTGTPKLLFKGPPVLYWTVARDGQRFLMAVPSAANGTTSTPYRVVLNWTSTLSF